MVTVIIFLLSGGFKILKRTLRNRGIGGLQPSLRGIPLPDVWPTVGVTGRNTPEIEFLRRSLYRGSASKTSKRSFVI